MRRNQAPLFLYPPHASLVDVRLEIIFVKNLIQNKWFVLIDVLMVEDMQIRFANAAHNKLDQTQLEFLIQNRI